MKITTLLTLLLLASPAATARAEKEHAAPVFALRTPEGIEKTLQSYRGKVVVLEFFASWCPSCMAAVPDLNALREQFPGRLEVVAVATAEDDPHGLDDFLAEYKPKYTILVDSSDRVARAYRVVGFPSYFVLDVNGNVQAHHMGNVDWTGESSMQVLERLVAQTPPADTTAPIEAPAPVTMAAR